MTTTTGFSVDDVTLILNTVYPGCEWSAQVVADTIEISLTERTLCEGCGQPITVTGPVTWLCHRHGDSQGGYSLQHGCGSWNTPHHSIRFHVRPLDEDQLFDLVISMAEEVLTAREVELSKRRAEIRDRLLRELAEVAASGEATGSEIEPGVFFDGDRWVAWAYDPDLSTGDIIEVTRP